MAHDDHEPDDDRELKAAFNSAFGDEAAWPKGVQMALVRGLVLAVEFATEKVAAALDTVARRKLVRNTAIVTAVVVTAISVPVTYILSSEGRHNNCELIRSIGEVQRERLREQGPEAQRFKRESKDRLGLSEKRFDELIAKSAAREQYDLSVYDRVANASC